jgi:hypothetical protein
MLLFQHNEIQFDRASRHCESPASLLDESFLAETITPLELSENTSVLIRQQSPLMLAYALGGDPARPPLDNGSKDGFILLEDFKLFLFEKQCTSSPNNVELIIGNTAFFKDGVASFISFDIKMLT